MRASAAIPKLVATAERNKTASDVQNQAGLALYYIIGGDDPDPTWRQVALDAGADARWLDGIKHRIKPPDEGDQVNARFREQFLSLGAAPPAEEGPALAKKRVLLEVERR